MPRPPEQMTSAPDVPVADVEAHLKPTMNGPGGYGVVNGRPYGEQLAKEREETAMTHRFVPGAVSRLRAATRRALGR